MPQFLLSAGVCRVRLTVVISESEGSNCHIIWKGSGRITNKNHSLDGGVQEEGSRLCLE